MAKQNLPTRKENYSEWYNDIIKFAGLAENSDVRWCMVIKPYWYAIWENIRDVLDRMFKNTWHENAYFPLFIPKSFFSKEASHVEWFAKECAVVTHYRLMNDPNWKWVIVDPDSKLDEELIVRPTSETIIWNTYKNWVNSYRDLPILINQRANVVRREMKTRAFLRTSEFLRQEWHTAHANAEEAKTETIKMLHVYNDFVTNFMAISPVLWQKSESEKFAGAEDTYCVEMFMQDGKALQSWTSHFLWQNFAKAFDVKFTNKENKLEYVRATSRWVSTRLIWWLIMSHSDDNWLVLPPAIAPLHVIIIPIFKTPEELEKIKNYLKPLTERMDCTELKFESDYFSETMKLKYKFDEDSNKSPWRKYNERELKWVPMRISAWMRDIENWTLEVYKRDTGEKTTIPFEQLDLDVDKELYRIQDNLLQKNIESRKNNTFVVNSREEFKQKIETWFVMAHRDETAETEARIKEETKSTIRCIPFESKEEDWVCVYSGKPSKKRVLFARSY